MPLLVERATGRRTRGSPPSSCAQSGLRSLPYLTSSSGPLLARLLGPSRGAEERPSPDMTAPVQTLLTRMLARICTRQCCARRRKEDALSSETTHEWGSVLHHAAVGQRRATHGRRGDGGVYARRPAGRGPGRYDAHGGDPGAGDRDTAGVLSGRWLCDDSGAGEYREFPARPAHPLEWQVLLPGSGRLRRDPLRPGWRAWAWGCLPLYPYPGPTPRDP